MELVWTDRSTNYLRTYDVMSSLRRVSPETIRGERKKRKGQLTKRSKYYPLKMYLAQCTKPVVTLSFQEIEKILGAPLSDSHRTNATVWYASKKCNRICEGWITEGYKMTSLDLKYERVALKRVAVDRLRAVPDAFLTSKVPEEAAFKLAQYAESLMKEYGIPS